MVALLRMIVLIVGAAATGAPDAGAPEPYLFVQKNVRWERTKFGYDVANGGVLAVDDGHNLLQMIATLYRHSKDRSITIDLKSGYLVSAGTWSRKNADAIQVKARVVDTYKLFSMSGGDPSKESVDDWAMSGDAAGPLRRTLRHGKEVFEPSSQFRDAALVLRFWRQFAGKTR
jgi:hypothetical protein